MIGLLFLWQALHHIYLKSLGLSLKGISLKNIELKPDAAYEESILNRHLDEIIYFFQSTKYDLVIIEDLDRFNNPDIFVTLREINGLVNANAGVKRKIRFLYALRDNMFVNTDKTKFFEFIIPVIPIINSSNSIDKVIEQGERLSLDERLDRQFLREVSRYLNDLRLIQNIFNEYSIYVANLETDGESILDANKLLAILIYKNVLPSDFEDLHREQGMLAEILKRHDQYVANAETEYKSRISELEMQISNAEKQVPNDLEELRKIYAMALVAKIPQGFITALDDGRQPLPFSDLVGHQKFEQIIEQNNITIRHANQNSTRNLNISDLQKSVDPNRTYKERKQDIERKTAEFRKQTSETIAGLRAKLSKLRLSKFNELIRTNPQGTEKLFDAFAENQELIRFLVLEGYLDDTYYQYTSLFHSGRLSPNDNKFLIQIRSFNNPEPNFPIDNPKEVIAAMRDDDFRQTFALNKTLVDCLFGDPSEYQTQITRFIGFVSDDFGKCADFFSIYYDTGKHVSEFLSALIDSWPSFVSTAIQSPNRNTHLARVLAHLPDKQLQKLHESNTHLSEYICAELSEILEQKIDFDPERMKLVPIEVEDLSSIEPYPAFARLLVEEGFYQISDENLAFAYDSVLGFSDRDNLLSKHYSTILQTGNTALINKVESSFEEYLQNVLIQRAENSEEDISVILKVINHHEIDSKPIEKFLELQSAKLPSLDQVPVRFHSALFQLQKIKISWENCLAYMASENYDSETLTAFLQQTTTLKTLASAKIANDDSASILWSFLLHNDEFDSNTYRTYIRCLPWKFKSFPQDVSNEKLQILVEEATVVFSVSSFGRLDDCEELQVLFIAKNIELYFENSDQFAIDDDFKEKLLESEITDNQRLGIIKDMELSLLGSLPTRASLIGMIYDRTQADISRLEVEVAEAIIVNSQPISTQISLFNKTSRVFSKEQVWNVIQQLPRPVSEIEPGYRSTVLPNTPVNAEFVKWLKKRRIISSWKLTFLDREIRIYPFRK